MEIEFRENTTNYKNELVVNGVVTHSVTPAIIFHTFVSNRYKKFEKKLNKFIGKKMIVTDTVTNKVIEGYYLGLCENFNGVNASYFFSNENKGNGHFNTIPYGIINEFKYKLVQN